MSKVSIKGVIIGSITDIVSSNIVQIPLFVYIVSQLSMESIPQDEIEKALMSAMKNNYIYFTIAMVLGSLCSILGGYISAKIAKHNEVLNGALSSFLCVGSGVYAMTAGGTEYTWWQHILIICFSISLSTIGGYIRLKQIQSKVQNA